MTNNPEQCREALKPCPCCGGDAQLSTRFNAGKIWCSKCLLCTNPEINAEAAIKTWNTRPQTPTPSEGKVEAAAVDAELVKEMVELFYAVDKATSDIRMMMPMWADRDGIVRFALPFNLAAPFMQNSMEFFQKVSNAKKLLCCLPPSAKGE